ncbi:LOW QUALITY PROTEIN: testis-specific serine/threonine-protein kinase 4-like [Amphiura filiformis]|uniref:LOW QUALITY PROTEIN: testis-specific serine/threonine-protein kinase 4-like n=1 Tax=Amphiura filiformis TaxID=82378 RepID=UPI003B2247A8
MPCEPPPMADQKPREGEKSGRSSSAATSKDKSLSVLEQHGLNVGHTLGQGSYATVKSAFSTKHKCKVAIKIVSKKKAPEDYLHKFLPREINVVKVLRHPNLVCFLQSIETTSRVYLVMEIADNGDLLDYIKSNGSVSESQAGVWWHQFVDGMEYCHSLGVVHRDLKCENLLLNKNNVKITDFGFARGNMKHPEPGRVVLSETYCGSYAYAPPEILRGTPYDPMLGDIWSMGIVLYTMVTGRLPFDDTNHKVLLQQVQKPPGFPSAKKISEDCKDLICRILQPAKRRINMSEIRETDWFARIAPTKRKTGATSRMMMSKDKLAGATTSAGEKSEGGTAGKGAKPDDNKSEKKPE